MSADADGGGCMTSNKIEIFDNDSLDRLEKFFTTNVHGDTQGLLKDISVLIGQCRYANHAISALVEIASFREGRFVNSSFDEPGSAKIARAALVPVLKIEPNV